MMIHTSATSYRLSVCLRIILVSTWAYFRYLSICLAMRNFTKPGSGADRSSQPALRQHTRSGCHARSSIPDQSRLGFVNARLNTDFSSTKPFSASFLLSSEGSNLNQLVVYETKYTFSSFVSPELTAGIHLFRSKNSTLGIQGRFF